MQSTCSIPAGASEQVAFAELTERYRHELQARCYRILRSVEDSEDAVQETFLRAWRYRTRVSADLSLRAWLHRIATNASIDVLHRRRFARPVAGNEAPADVLDVIAAPGLAPDDAVVAKEATELALEFAVRNLPPRQHTALILRYVLGCSAKDAASVLDTSPASVHSAVQRATTTLRERLSETPLDRQERTLAACE